MANSKVIVSHFSDITSHHTNKIYKIVHVVIDKSMILLTECVYFATPTAIGSVITFRERGVFNRFQAQYQGERLTFDWPWSYCYTVVYLNIRKSRLKRTLASNRGFTHDDAENICLCLCKFVLLYLNGILCYEAKQSRPTAFAKQSSIAFVMVCNINV